MQRGEIWWASMGSPRRSEPGHRRPVLIIQSNEFNRSRIATVIAATVTAKLELARAPGNVLLSRRASGLRKQSVVNLSQVVTLDRSFLTEKVRKLSDRQMAAVEAGLRLILDLR